jgi:hypothetical protein
MALIDELIQGLKRRPLDVQTLNIVDRTGHVLATISAGVGSPEGSVVAGAGSLYLNLSGGVNTSLYTKESGGAVAATGTLTGTTIANGNTVAIAGKVYTFRTAISAAYDVLVGASDSDSLDNLISAINGSAGAGSTYGTGTVAHPSVVAAAGAGDTMDATARVGGTAGNSIATTATLTAGTWGAATLTGGLAAVATGWAAH